jgi:hypothetical protein
MHSTFGDGTFDFGSLSLNLKANFPAIAISVCESVQAKSCVLVHNFQRVRKDLFAKVRRRPRREGPTHHLATSSSTTGDQFPVKLNTTSLRIHSTAADDVVDSQFDSFFRCNTLGAAYSEPPKSRHPRSTYNKLGSETAVESQKALIPENFLGTIETVFVEHLADNGTPLVLHPGHLASAQC